MARIELTNDDDVAEGGSELRSLPFCQLPNSAAAKAAFQWAKKAHYLSSCTWLTAIDKDKRCLPHVHPPQSRQRWRVWLLPFGAPGEEIENVFIYWCELTRRVGSPGRQRIITRRITDGANVQKWRQLMTSWVRPTRDQNRSPIDRQTNGEAMRTQRRRAKIKFRSFHVNSLRVLSSLDGHANPFTTIKE